MLLSCIFLNFTVNYCFEIYRARLTRVLFVVADNLRRTFPLNDPLPSFTLPDSPLLDLSHLQVYTQDMMYVRRLEALYVVSLRGELQFEQQAAVLQALQTAWRGKNNFILSFLKLNTHTNFWHPLCFSL